MKIGVLSDAHGHIFAFQKAISLLKAEGVEEIFFLGDAVGYVPLADVVFDLMQAGYHYLKGNHEQMLLLDQLSAAQENIYQLSDLRVGLTRQVKEHLKLLPHVLFREWRCGKVQFVHGSPKDPLNGYIYPDTDLTLLVCERTDFVFMGHTHRPFVRDFEGVTYVNVGSCAFPRDHGNLGAVCVFDTCRGNIEILRFCLQREHEALKRIASLHSVVLSLFSRVSQDPPYGKLCTH